MKNKFWLLVILLFLLIAPSHLIANDQTITIDEPWWVISGSNYYYALTHQDFENTRYDYHPAVTTTWVVTAGMVSYFPEYRGFGQGYFDVRKPNFEEFFKEQNKKPLNLLRNARIIQTLVILSFAVLAFYFLQLIITQSSAFLSVALAMLSPFFLGHARIFNHEGMLALFVLVSLLAMQVYLNKEKKIIYLILSGVAFGLAQLTKSSSVVLIGLVGLMLLVNIIQKDEKPLLTKLIEATKTFGIWFASAAFIYFVIWPGMWVNPARMLGEVYGNAFSYAFQGARLDVTEELEPATFSLDNRINGLKLYLTYWLSGTTFITWFGLLFAGFSLFAKKKISSLTQSTMFWLLILGALFISIFGLVQGRNHAHYIMSSFVAFDIIAGIGWGYVWMLAQEKWQVLNRVYTSLLFVTVLALTQIGFGLPYAPYYFTYKNPLASRAATLGYGEGYNLAADYLMQKPNANELKAYVYNGMGTFSYFFSGETLVFKRVYLIDQSYAQIVQEIQESDYLVMYPVIRNQQPETAKIFEILDGVTPEKTIVINGIDYVYIYQTADIPEWVYQELLAE